jgi:hypothetical protein
MDFMTFLAKVIEFLAWPITIIVLVKILRAEIKALLPFLKKLKAGPVEAEFERDIKEIKEYSKVQSGDVARQGVVTPEQQMLLQLVQINPRAAVLEAWRGVEQSAIRVIQNKAIYVPERESRSPLALIRALNKEKILSEDEISLYHELRMLRNQAAHTQDFSPTTDAALAYIDMASGLKNSLDASAKT